MEDYVSWLAFEAENEETFLGDGSVAFLQSIELQSSSSSGSDYKKPFTGKRAKKGKLQQRKGKDSRKRHRPKTGKKTGSPLDLARDRARERKQRTRVDRKKWRSLYADDDGGSDPDENADEAEGDSPAWPPHITEEIVANSLRAFRAAVSFPKVLEKCCAVCACNKTRTSTVFFDSSTRMKLKCCS